MLAALQPLIDKLCGLKQDAVWQVKAAYILDTLDAEARKHFLQASKEDAIQIIQDSWYKDGPHYQPGSWLHDLWHDEVQGHYKVTPTGRFLGPDHHPHANHQTCSSKQRPGVTSTHQRCCCGGHNTSSTSMDTSADKSRPITGRPDALFICPITQELMNDPVLAADGILYERAAIEKWLSAHNTSPMTNLPLPHKNLTPCYGLRSSVQEYRTANGLYCDGDCACSNGSG